jgi:Ig-like domain from next to BRCA1 gene
MHGIARYILLMVIFTLLVSACAFQATPVPTVAPDVFYTQAVQTMDAQSTLRAGETAVAELTRLASIPTELPSPTAPLPSPTEPAPTSTSTPPAPTAIPSQPECDLAQLVLDVPIANNGILTPGASFTKSWQVQNISSCAWTQFYSLMLISGQASYSSNLVPLAGTVRPGEVVMLSVYGSAPLQPGSYMDLWMLRDPQGGLYGWGANSKNPFTAQYTVAQPYGGSPTLTWHRQGGSNAVCDELRIYLNGSQSGMAVASSCKQPGQIVGNMPLAPDELAQMIDWVNRFSYYNAEIYSAIPGGPPVQAYMTFNGRGNANASDADIQAMQGLAESLFNSITP